MTLHHSAFQAITTVLPRFGRAKIATCKRQIVRCSTLSNIAQIPLELIPGKGDLPAHWSKPGVYGVYDKAGELQYVASVLNVREAIDAHRIVINDSNRVHSVRMIVVNNADEAPLDELAENWVRSTITISDPPPGNWDKAPEWHVVPEKIVGPDVMFRENPTDPKLEIMHILQRHRIVLFMKGTSTQPMCGFSYQTLNILRDLAGDKLKLVNCLDAENNPGLRDAIKSFSEWPTIPQLYVNGDFVGGADIVASLAQSGELKSMIDEAAAMPAYLVIQRKKHFDVTSVQVSQHVDPTMKSNTQLLYQFYRLHYFKISDASSTPCPRFRSYLHKDKKRGGT